MITETPEEAFRLMEVAIKFGLFIVGLIGGIWIGRAEVYKEWNNQSMMDAALARDGLAGLNNGEQEGEESNGKEKVGA